MKRKGNLMLSSFVVLILLVTGSFDLAIAKNPQTSDPSGASCPYQDVKEVQGSKIVFQEDAFDFGQIPTNRKVTHIFRFQNVGTAPLLLAPHVKSKPIEGC
jgi:hypothetical protein